MCTRSLFMKRNMCMIAQFISGLGSLDHPLESKVESKTKTVLTRMGILRSSRRCHESPNEAAGGDGAKIEASVQ